MRDEMQKEIFKLKQDVKRWKQQVDQEKAIAVEWQEQLSAKETECETLNGKIQEKQQQILQKAEEYSYLDIAKADFTQK